MKGLTQKEFEELEDNSQETKTEGTGETTRDKVSRCNQMDKTPDTQSLSDFILYFTNTTKILKNNQFLLVGKVKEFIKKRIRGFSDALRTRNNTEEKVRKAVIKEIQKMEEESGDELT